MFNILANTFIELLQMIIKKLFTIVTKKKLRPRNGMRMRTEFVYEPKKRLRIKKKLCFKDYPFWQQPSNGFTYVQKECISARLQSFFCTHSPTENDHHCKWIMLLDMVARSIELKLCYNNICHEARLDLVFSAVVVLNSHI